MTARVLIVEDDPALRHALARVATRWGSEVLHASNAREGIAMLEADPRLLIIDLRLPDGDAFDVVEPAMRRRPSPTVVAMSGLASPEETFRLAQAGVRAFLRKPMGVPDLVEAVEAALREAPSLELFAAASVGRRPMRALQGELRKVMVDQALAMSNGSRAGAARLLAVSRQAVQQIVREREGDAGRCGSPRPGPEK